MSSSIVQNPLDHVQFRIPFDRIQASDVVPAVTALLKEARERLDALAAQPGERTFENTMRALDELTEPLDYAIGIVRHLESVATYPELRAAYNQIQPEVSAFYTGIPLHSGLWQAIKTFAGTPEGRELAGERRRYLHKTMETFRRHGADLDPAGKKRLEEIDVELTKVTTQVFRERARFHQRFRAADHPRRRPGGPAAHGRGLGAGERSSQRPRRAGASPCRPPTISR